MQKLVASFGGEEFWIPVRDGVDARALFDAELGSERYVFLRVEEMSPEEMATWLWGD